MCSTLRKQGTDVCDTYFIRAVVLEQGVLQHLRYVISFVASLEDKANGALNESRFKMLAKDYEQEQQKLSEGITVLAADVTQQEEQSDNIERFIGKVHKYFALQELTPTILNDIVQRVYVHAPDKINGKRIQQIDIYYDLAGFLPISLFKTETRNGAA